MNSSEQIQKKQTTGSDVRCLLLRASIELDLHHS